jgi:hypothetical protein
MAEAEKRGWAARLVREPLFHFAVVGLLFYGAAEYLDAENDRYRIEVTPDTIEHLRTAYEAEFGNPPEDDMIDQLVADHVDAEMLYREGVARGLDVGDEVVRRRVIQKVAFLETGVDMPADPSGADLRAWYEDHADRYADTARVDFEHVFFKADADRADAARARAQAVLAALAPKDRAASGKGDPFPDLYAFTGFTPPDAQRLFGSSEMATALFSAPVGRWSGPFRSSYGWHLVRVSKAEAGKPQSFDAVRDKVLADYREGAREEADARRLARLKARYSVVRADR